MGDVEGTMGDVVEFVELLRKRCNEQNKKPFALHVRESKGLRCSARTTFSVL
jgi:hypothetical protein